MPLILHIGYHKTGSTAIQNFLGKNGDVLKERGVVVPPGLSRWLGHPELAWCFEASPYPWQDRTYSVAETIQHYRPYLRRSLDPAVTVVVSSEEFCRLEFDLNAMLRLREALAPYDPIIVGFAREPLAFLLSRYRHEVQNGGERRSLREFLLNLDNMRSASFRNRVNVWQRLFPGACVFKSYEARTRESGSIVRSFLGMLGVALDTAAFDETDEDVKLHPVLLDLARVVVGSNLPEAEKEAIFLQAFELSSRLPAVPLDRVFDAIGLPQEVSMAVSSIHPIEELPAESIQAILANRKPPKLPAAGAAGARPAAKPAPAPAKPASTKPAPPAAPAKAAAPKRRKPR